MPRRQLHEKAASIHSVRPSKIPTAADARPGDNIGSHRDTIRRKFKSDSEPTATAMAARTRRS